MFDVTQLLEAADIIITADAIDLLANLDTTTLLTSL
ncbi:hypothetical protein CIP107546_00417 [Corynebacterium diphtheriae]|nr:hypothetical protein CIP107546_00417 [Corynebacterium diphtheriae]CAB0683800.1 hypothetical protein FRC0028_00608 [Corynebacterium diphtheriae]CAB0683836.1 hypothetical protein FRC0081_00607 [Corynebacterium diphtheriae]CAB0739778.1 hypothetical protein FRC0134_00606 [Corynebacterium diphtheriae]CAB0768900.1 hypothetical protein FRC0174_00621 [Corynebacterium diphtheriae]